LVTEFMVYTVASTNDAIGDRVHGLYSSLNQ